MKAPQIGEATVRRRGRVLAMDTPNRHECQPGAEYRWHEHDPTAPHPLPTGWIVHSLQLPTGTVWECECGTTWVSEPHPAPNCFTNVWVRESWWARRRRRKADRAWLTLRSGRSNSHSSTR